MTVVLVWSAGAAAAPFAWLAHPSANKVARLDLASHTTTSIAVADCVLEAQLARVAEAVAAEYGSACGVATGAGIASLHPGLCGP